MNIIDTIIVCLILLYALNGLYRGFLPSILNLGMFFLSWLISFLCYPLVAAKLVTTDFFSSFEMYVEGTEWLPSFEYARADVSSLSDQQLTKIVSESRLPPPFDTAITASVKGQVFADSGATTLGEYYNLTIYSVIINIISLLLLFLALRLIFTLLANAFTYGYQLPALRHFEYPSGAAVGLIRGFFSMYLLFMLVPIALVLLRSIDLVTNTVNGSWTSGIFYSSSIALRFISGHI